MSGALPFELAAPSGTAQDSNPHLLTQSDQRASNPLPPAWKAGARPHVLRSHDPAVPATYLLLVPRVGSREEVRYLPTGSDPANSSPRSSEMHRPSKGFEP